jgi:hypothetical protein
MLYFVSYVACPGYELIAGCTGAHSVVESILMDLLKYIYIFCSSEIMNIICF